MGLCNTTGFLRIIVEISLSVHICVVTDDLDGVLVSTNSTVSTKAPEFTACCAFAGNVNLWKNWQRQMCNVIHDTDCKVVLRSIQFQVFIYRNNLTWSNVFRTKTITSAYDRSLFSSSVESSQNIQVYWFADRAVFFISVKNSDLCSCFRNSCKESILFEWSVKVNLN